MCNEKNHARKQMSILLGAQKRAYYPTQGPPGTRMDLMKDSCAIHALSITTTTINAVHEQELICSPISL